MYKVRVKCFDSPFNKDFRVQFIVILVKWHKLLVTKNTIQKRVFS
jgi:hypothetical protein